MTESEVLHKIREVAGDAKYFEMLEDVRQLGIWSCVRVYCENKVTTTGVKKDSYNKPYEAMKAITAKYPDLKIYLSQYVTVCEDMFKRHVGRSIVGDGTGYLKHCLATFGEELP